MSDSIPEETISYEKENIKLFRSGTDYFYVQNWIHQYSNVEDCEGYEKLFWEPTDIKHFPLEEMKIRYPQEFL